MNQLPTKILKPSLHQRNHHRQGYDFLALLKTLPELSPYIIHNNYGNLSIDFANPSAVKMLNKALLLHFYKLTYWDIPNGYLCPPIPSRADYIHYLADLLAQDNQNKVPLGKHVKVLDIGVGANLIYPIIGHAEYGWSFVGSDINAVAINAAKLIVTANLSLQKAIQCRLQSNSQVIFADIIKPQEFFMLTLCNPPFHASAQHALETANKKITNLNKNLPEKPKVILNFGGQDTELWCEGGESGFITNMIVESRRYKTQCLWFSSLVSKQETLAIIKRKLRQIGALDIKIVTMSQGNKISRFVAWTFLAQEDRCHLIKQYQHNLEQ